MDNFNPKVSIIIPVYNGANYMREAIDSALAQTYDNLEVIVVNDGSQDNTEDIALSYGDKIRYFSKKNGGQSTALNLGIEKMEGDYFSWLSHDDLYYPEKIQRQIEVLSKLKNKTVILYSNWNKIDETGKTIRKVHLKTNPKQIRFELLMSAPLNGCSVLIPKKCFDQFGVFNTKRPHTSDVELFFKFSEFVPYHHMEEALICTRQHSQQATNRNYSYHKYETDVFLLDSINKMSNNELVELSAFNKIENVLIFLAKLYSKSGHKLVFQLMISRLRNTTLTPSYECQLLKLKCFTLYNYKVLRNFIKIKILKY